MKLAQRSFQTFAVVCLSLLMIGCFAVKVKKGVDNPDPHFDRAKNKIDHLHRIDPERKGYANEIMVLVYNRSDQELIQIEAPVWLVNRGMDIGIKASEEEEEFTFEKGFEFDWRELKDLNKLGPGLLVEVIDEESWVLVWIE